MTGKRESVRAALLSLLVVVSVVVGSVAFAGSASASANNLEVVSEQPVSGTGDLTVRTTVSSIGADALFKVKDAAGTVSQMKTVTDGGTGDQATADGVIQTSLDLDSLFETKPASGTAVVYAEQGGDTFSISQQTFDAKRQVNVDSVGPTATITGSAKSTPAEAVTAQPGDQVKVFYTAADTPQGLQSVTMTLTGPNGEQKELTGLGSGTDRGAQFVVPSDWSAGEYDVSLTAIDEAGHTTTDTFQGGLVLESTSSSAGSATASNLEVVGSQPLEGTGTATVRAAVSSTGAPVSFKMKGPSGTVSGTKTVTDGGTGDQATASGVVQTTLDLESLFGTTPASGTAILYAGGGESFSISRQTFDTKQQVTLDSTPPTAIVLGGATSQPAESITAQPGDQIKVYYTVTDTPQKVQSATMTITGPNGASKRFTGLQAGEGAAVQFVVPSDWSAGEYDVSLTAIDEAGYTASDTFQSGLVLESAPSSVTASNLRLVGTPPIKGTGTATVEVRLSSPGSKASFVVNGPSSKSSATKTVTDGSSGDQSASAGVVKTPLDFGALFDTKPASGTAVIYAGGGESISVSQQTFDAKRQVSVDSDAPTAKITAGSANQPTPVYTQSGTQTQIAYRATDVPQKVRSVTMTIRGPDGNVRRTFTGLQGGSGQNAQFVVPGTWAEGEYDISMTVVDEVGHEATDSYENGLVVDNTHPSVVSVTTGHVPGGPSTKTRKVVIDLREPSPLQRDSISKKAIDVVGEKDYAEKELVVQPDSDVVITLGPPTATSDSTGSGSGSSTDTSDEAPLLDRGEQPAVYLEKGYYIADKAGNRLMGKTTITDSARDGLRPKNPDEISVSPSVADEGELSSVRVGVMFRRVKESTSSSSDSTSGSGGGSNTDGSSTTTVADPPESGTIYVRFTGPDGTTVVKTMPTETGSEASYGTFDLSGSGLSSGDVKVEAKIVDDSVSGWENAHGYDAPTYFTIDKTSS